MNKTKNNQSYQSGRKHRTPIYRRPWLWIFVVSIIVIVAIFIFFNSNHPETSSEDTRDEQSGEVTSDEDSRPQAENEYTDDESAPDPKVIQNEGDNPNNLNELTGSVSSKNVVDGTLVIMTNVDQYLNGTCHLEMRGRNTSDTYDITTNLSADVSTSYCETFRIPLSALMNDYYEITITLSGNNKTGVITDGVEL